MVINHLLHGMILTRLGSENGTTSGYTQIIDWKSCYTREN